MLANNPSIATLSREIRSSPPRPNSTILGPLQVSDLALKPTRRILFPSPRPNKDQRPLGETGANPDKPSEDVDPKGDRSRCLDDDPSDKENRPPTPTEDRHFDDILEDSHQSVIRPTTPSPSKIADPELFKTPGNPDTPDRLVPVTGDFFSSAAKLLFHPTTPIQTLPKFQQMPSSSELTPFSRQIRQILSDVNDASPSGATGNLFDFSALPYLNLTPKSHTQQDLGFSNFDHQDFLSTDMPIPSSPSWFGVYEDPMESSGDLWGDFQLPTSPDQRLLSEAEKTQRPVSDQEATTEEPTTVTQEGEA